jgi:two-component system, cell cycle response regulator DivK
MVPTILAIDDDQIFQILVKRIVEPMGAEVVSAYSSDEGLEMARQILPAVILMDIRLPGRIGDGWTLARIMKEDPDLQHIPLIMVSASGGGMGGYQPESGPNDGYFSKPFKVDVFRDAILRLLP